jgi:hypothetical protein
MAWNPELDAELTRLRNSGLSFRQISKLMGVSRNAAICRFHLLKGTPFPSNVARQLERKGRIEEQAERQARQQRILARLEVEIADGRDRDSAIRDAYEAGASTSMIGRTLGISGQRVWQIAVSAQTGMRKPKAGAELLPAPDPQLAS